MARITTGIDIGTEEAKIVCLEAGEDGARRLASYGVFSFEGNESRLRAFIRSAELPSGEIRTNIEDQSLKIRRLDLPQMSDAEMNEAVRWGMKDIVEGDVTAFTFRHVKISQEDLEATGKIPLLVFAIKTEAIEKRYDLFKRLGLKTPRIIEPNAGALQSIFAHSLDPERAGPQVIINLGRLYSGFLVIGRKGIVFSRPLNGCGEDHLRNQIARDLGIQSEEAERLKKTHFAAAGGSSESDLLLKNTISQFYSKLAVEVQRSIDGYNLVFGKQKIETIHLCGRGAYYADFIDYLDKTIGIGVKMFDPFKNIDVGDFSPGPLDEKRALFAVACGLAVD
jgi:type IV pilus assembly protein PilM